MTFPKRPLELYTYTAEQSISKEQWREILSNEHCQYLEKKCGKVRKSQPDITIGTCAVGYKHIPIIICPHRFLEHRQIFLDTLHLLRQHKPGNQLHVVSEISIPGGSVDYFVASVHRGEVKDYVALEIQALDTTGTVWPSRQQFISNVLNIPVKDTGVELTEEGNKSYGMNWKMTAKTILVQMHHKVETLELLGKKMVLIMQDAFYDYLRANFSTAGLRDTEPSDSAHFHIYGMSQRSDGAFSIELALRKSTTTVGIGDMLGLRQSARIPEEDLLAKIQAKISDATLLRI